MDWIHPKYSIVLHKQLTKYHGNITIENVVKDVVSIVQTGNVHIAVYDLFENKMAVSFAQRRAPEDFGIDEVELLNTEKNAFARQFTVLDMTKVFAEAMPQV